MIFFRHKQQRGHQLGEAGGWQSEIGITRKKYLIAIHIIDQGRIGRNLSQLLRLAQLLQLHGGDAILRLVRIIDQARRAKATDKWQCDKAKQKQK